CRTLRLLNPHLVMILLLLRLADVAATTVTYTVSLHDALPISRRPGSRGRSRSSARPARAWPRSRAPCAAAARGYRTPSGGCARRSEEHTSELQSRVDIVCRLLLEKKKLELYDYDMLIEHNSLC